MFRFAFFLSLTYLLVCSWQLQGADLQSSVVRVSWTHWATCVLKYLDDLWWFQQAAFSFQIASCLAAYDGCLTLLDWLLGFGWCSTLVMSIVCARKLQIIHTYCAYVSWAYSTREQVEITLHHSATIMNACTRETASKPAKLQQWHALHCHSDTA